VDDALKMLLPIAVQNSWAANEDRNEHAKKFVKLVRRRFK
jgi:hypothetical protein